MLKSSYAFVQVWEALLKTRALRNRAGSPLPRCHHNNSCSPLIQGFINCHVLTTSKYPHGLKALYHVQSTESQFHNSKAHLAWYKLFRLQDQNACVTIQSGIPKLHTWLHQNSQFLHSCLPHQIQSFNNHYYRTMHKDAKITLQGVQQSSFHSCLNWQVQNVRWFVLFLFISPPLWLASLFDNDATEIFIPSIQEGDHSKNVDRT